MHWILDDENEWREISCYGEAINGVQNEEEDVEMKDVMEMPAMVSADSEGGRETKAEQKGRQAKEVRAEHRRYPLHVEIAEETWLRG